MPNDEEIVFYVDEELDDFTFYLDPGARDVSGERTNTEAIEALRRRSCVDPDENDYKSWFGFAERIVFKPLRRGLKSIDDEFWTSFGKPNHDPSVKYLIGLLGGRNRSLVDRLKNGTRLDDTEKLAALKLIEEMLISADADELTLQLKLAAAPESRIIIDGTANCDPTDLNRRLLVERGFPQLHWKQKTGRALICYSACRQYFSVNVRALSDDSGYEPLARKTDSDKDSKAFLFSIEEYCKQIYALVFNRPRVCDEGADIEGSQLGQMAHGLLVITGSTYCAKSEIARGLIYLHLQEQKKAYLEEKSKGRKTRRPHLVTFEDPIEQRYLNATELHGPTANGVDITLTRIDYTPRQKDTDVDVLRTALRDALRQTPKVFFVAETRNKREWELLLDFAATGHLIVTTAHAGSLVESMHKIFEARDVSTAADRSEIANKLLGVVHLRNGAVEIDDENTTNVLFPAVWHQTPRGIAALTSDGLASLLPHRPGDVRDDVPSCVGRRWFIEQLITSVNGRKPNPENVLEKIFGENFEKPFCACNQRESIRTRAYRQATEWDLEGV
jgi:hypothetical protein